MLFFVWRFNAQLEDDLAARQRVTPPPPASTPSLALLRELPELPPLREATPVVALPEATAPATDASGVIDTQPLATPQASAVVTGSAPAESTAPAAAVAVSQDSAPAAAVAASDESTPAATLPPSASIASAEPAVIAPPASATPPSAATSSAAALVPAPPVADIAALTAPATPPAGRVPSGVCVRIGPFAQDAEALRVSRWLRPRSSRVDIRHDGAASRPLFGIYLEPRSASEREQNLRDLASQGIRDVLPVRREGMSHAISLGVFSSQENVNRRLAEIEKQGYRPIVVPRRDVGGTRYVEAELAAGFEDPARLPAAEMGGAAVKPVTCRP